MDNASCKGTDCLDVAEHSLLEVAFQHRPVGERGARGGRTGDVATDVLDSRNTKEPHHVKNVFLRARIDVERIELIADRWCMLMQLTRNVLKDRLDDVNRSLHPS